MKNGFTLIELLTVSAIIVIIASITVLFLRTGTADELLENTARALATDLRHASELASTTQINHALRFYIDANRYEVVELSAPEVIQKNVYLDSALDFGFLTLPNSQAEFNTLGAAVAPGSITIEHNTGLDITVDVRPSGYVRIE